MTNKYDDVFDEAESEADKELEGKLKDFDFGSSDIVMKVDEDDRDAVNNLISQVNQAANSEETKSAWKNFMSKVGIATIKTVRKAVLGGLGALFLLAATASPSMAQNDSMAQLGEFIKAMSFGAGVSVFPDASDPRTEAIAYWRGPQFGQKGLSLIPDKNDPEAKPYLDFNIGGRWKKGEPAKAFPMVLMHPGNLMEPIGKRISSRWRLPTFPSNLVAGPAFRVPLPGDSEPWTPKTGIRLVVGWEF